MITVLAPAKLNLYLHITGRRDDGYHLLDSFFIFTTLSDVITIHPANTVSLSISGDCAAALSHELLEKNSVYRAAIYLQKHFHIRMGVAIHLQKNIPVGAGLGGGSSDTAAVLNALNTFWNIHCDQETLEKIGLSLGADVPVCLTPTPALVTGIGENIQRIMLPRSSIPVLLVNPNKPLSTPAVYQQFRQEHASFSEPLNLKINTIAWPTLLTLLSDTRNDLQPSAIQLMPEIAVLLTRLSEQTGCLLARMSGSGATCFALFQTQKDAVLAQKAILMLYPTYWSCVVDIYA